jgi:hypothetical protein
LEVRKRLLLGTPESPSASTKCKNIISWDDHFFLLVQHLIVNDEDTSFDVLKHDRPGFNETTEEVIQKASFAFKEYSVG